MIKAVWEDDKLVNRQVANIFYGRSGRVYEGQVRSNGVIDGEGAFYFASNASYKGSFKYNTL